MKKALLLSALVIVFTMTSCKKDYTCECTTTVSGNGSTQSATASTTINDKKDDAKAACEKGNQTVDQGGGMTSTVKCEIK